MTPTGLSRIDILEKNLNDRLAYYIEKYLQLQNENQSFRKQITQYEENMFKNRVKKDDEQEIMKLKKLIDETARDKNRIENEMSLLKHNFEDAKSKLDKEMKDHQLVRKFLAKIEKDHADLQANFSRASTERDKLKKDFEGEIGRLQREVTELRNQLEKESLTRVKAENILRNQNKQLDLTTQPQPHEQEITEMGSRHQIEIQEVDCRLQQEYGTKLQGSIQELRQEHEAQLNASKHEMDNLYDQKYADMKTRLKRAQSSSAQNGEKIGLLQSRLDMSIQNSSKYEQKKKGMLRRIKDLEKKSDDDHSRFAKMLESRDNQIDALVNEKSVLMTNYQDLMDTKEVLENEKRGYEEEYIDSIVDLEMVSESKEDLQIFDDFEGKFIRLENYGEKDVSLSGWTLTRKSGEMETTCKFNRQMKLKPKGNITIWSSDAIGASHEPPSNLTMTGEKWFPGEIVTTTLLNNSNEEIAMLTTKQIIRRKR